MSDRGQTNLDFAIGVSILLVTIVAALTFVPGLFSTVDEGRADADAVGANRAASHLVEERLGHPSQPGRLDADCTVAFFGGPTDGSGCGIASGDDAADHLPLDATGPTQRHSFNVTLRNGTDFLCWDANAKALVNESQSGCDPATNTDDQVLTAGSVSAGGSDVAVTRRAVVVDGTYATLVVRVW